MTTQMTLGNTIEKIRHEKQMEEQRRLDMIRSKLAERELDEVTKATSLLMHEKILNAAKDGCDHVVICDTRTVPSFDGRSIYQLFKHEANAGGNLYCAFRDLKLTTGQIYNTYPAFCIIRDHYLAQGLKVHLEANYDSGGIDDWIELVVTF